MHNKAAQGSAWAAGEYETAPPIIAVPIAINSLFMAVIPCSWEQKFRRKLHFSQLKLHQTAI
ncbi:hypothetical protein NBRC3257_3345 [Gluconobacter thailandicus NBRC 3257]|uniref:Uncharacterized protein n=2 Tax=Acetobacteraceae TaxID=433 RepID=G2I8N1_KOMMN|nr:hypothetical protein [Komagataeibacter medellinensis]KXV29673.1 hypothetical protein AD937_00310 [Gluconobacter japonicus]KXV55102.1 hypothetical protein AD946_00310 [Gluconobacter thailandicus]GAC89517.1 hypothetical protein NBRC3255_3178 [Gluconobacter thailandicus NBRC 3255]GAD28346.1 hypothetical protein NBRC3257_3345 [Gluconobacter thailandicus NBRC 3257]BAK85281.1 hypothetical protein GLX_31200 [Komagataeibacter medellinensis NBRC 3288]